MAAPTKVYPKGLNMRVTESELQAAISKAKRLGFSSVSEMIRAYVTDSPQAA